MSALNVKAPAFIEDEELTIFADAVDRFLDEHCGPEEQAKGREIQTAPRDLWRKAGEAVRCGLTVPEEYGGAGGDYRHEVVLMRRMGLKGADNWGISLHNAIEAPYEVHYGTEEQKRRVLPQLCTGDYVGAIAIAETDGLEGFERGRNLHKIGAEGNDTSELFFNDVRVPASNLISGAEGMGFVQLMQQLPQERLNIAVQGI